MNAPVRALVVVLGDQLDPDGSGLQGFDASDDVIWMCECAEEATYAWSHRARLVTFLSAMRHFAASQRARGRRVIYRATDDHAFQSIRDALRDEILREHPQRVVIVEPGEWRLQAALIELAAGFPDVVFEWRADTHFLCSRPAFEEWMRGRVQPRMEHFYRRMRQQTGWLMDVDGSPLGGRWNFDEENRESFDARGPGLLPDPRAFPADDLTHEVMRMVERRYGDHPGSLHAFDWPVTREEALLALEDFIEHRLDAFGPYQDAMWSALTWPRALLYHSRLSAALNLKLLDPREVCAAAIGAYHAGRARLASVEGFVRQILGWREYVRGLYWHRMPGYLDDNALDAQEPLPGFYWTGQTEMNCLRQVIGETLAHGYAHHIQRLMITGLYALLLGVRPREVHAWYLAVYVDAVEWVELPNTLGMSQHADGGFMASKPYVASGKYIERMSDYCAGCRFRPDVATGPKACPVTTLYWDFLDRHASRFSAHPRLKMQLRNLERKTEAERRAIREQAAAHRGALHAKVQA